MRAVPLTVCLVLTALLVGDTVGGGKKKPPPVTWEEDFDAARALARKAGKPLFVVIRCER